MAHPLTDPQLDALRQALPRLFGNLDEEAFAAMRPHLQWEWVERAGGEVLFNEGEPSDSLYVLMSATRHGDTAPWLQRIIVVLQSSECASRFSKKSVIQETSWQVSAPNRSTMKLYAVK